MADIVGTLAMATDLGLGLPVEHAIRACLMSIAVGRSIQTTAADLHLAPKTVDFHLQNIYSKVGVSSRAAATLFAIQNDLVQA